METHHSGIPRHEFPGAVDGIHDPDPFAAQPSGVVRRLFRKPPLAFPGKPREQRFVDRQVGFRDRIPPVLEPVLDGAGREIGENAGRVVERFANAYEILAIRHQSTPSTPT